MNNKQIIKQWVRKNGLLVGFFIFLIIVAFNAPAFLSLNNILDVVRQVSITGIIAIGVTCVVITGRFDLSVGSMLTLLTVIMVDQHNMVGPFAAIVIVLCAGIFIGLINGVLVGLFKLNALIVTLAMLSLLQGVTLLYSGGSNVNVQNPQDTWFRFFGRDYFLYIPMPVWIFIIITIIASFILAKTRFGRAVYAVGGNETASRFSGVQSQYIVLICYVISGFCTAWAAIIMGSRVMGAQNTIGQGYELTVLAGIILGGTSLMGGSGSVWRTFIGISMLGFISNGLILLGFPYYVQWLVTWAVIVLAVWMDVAAKRGRIIA